MSFSKDIKEELSKINNLANKDNVKAEMIGYLLSNNIEIKKNKIRYATENEYNINRFNKLLNNLKIDYSIQFQGKVYIITFSKDTIKELEYVEICNYRKIQNDDKNVTLNSKGQDINKVEDINKRKDINKESYINKENIQINKQEINQKSNEQFLKAIVRGAFLGCGSLNNPNNKYHLEIVFSTQENAKDIYSILKKFYIQSKILKRKNSYSTYIKEAEEISKFLALIGANKSVLNFEEIRVVRDTRNNINRLVNCETANLNKTINAAVKQINAIKVLKQNKKFKDLPNNLKEIANLRIENPDASLIELGQMLQTPIGKSGVNHRLKKICELAKEGKSNEI